MLRGIDDPPTVRRDRRVRVHADNQYVAETTSVLEIPHVAGMEQVEDAIGKDDAPAARPL